MTCNHPKPVTLRDGTENYKTAIQWCPECGAIKHPTLDQYGYVAERELVWQTPKGWGRS